MGVGREISREKKRRKKKKTGDIGEVVERE